MVRIRKPTGKNETQRNPVPLRALSAGEERIKIMNESEKHFHSELENIDVGLCPLVLYVEITSNYFSRK